MVACQSQIIAVSKAGQNVQLFADSHGAHLFRTVTDHLVDDGQGIFAPVADGDGAAQEFAA